MITFSFDASGMDYNELMRLEEQGYDLFYNADNSHCTAIKDEGN